MKTYTKALEHVAREYPHSIAIVEAFAPLLEQKRALADALPECLLPPLSTDRLTDGKVWLDPAVHVDVYLDEPFLKKAPSFVSKGIVAGFPALAEAAIKIQAVLEKDLSACRTLAANGLERAKTENWADLHGLDKAAVQFFSAHLGGFAAERVGRYAQAATDFRQLEVKEQWTHGYCPVCGANPHLSLIRGKDGQRFLQCSMCRTEWIFPRTTCPSCKEDTLKKLQYFFIEKNEQDRVQCCESCKGYILEKDLRNDAGEVPLDMYALCLSPLDVLMQEKGYTAILEKTAA